MPKPDPRQDNLFETSLESTPPEPIALRNEWRQCKRDLGYAEKRWERAREAVSIAENRGLATARLRNVQDIADQEILSLKRRMSEIEAKSPDLGFD